MRANKLILRGYGPLAALVALILIVTMLVPSRPKKDETAQFLDTGTGVSAPGEVLEPGGSPALATGPAQVRAGAEPNSTTAAGPAAAGQANPKSGKSATVATLPGGGAKAAKNCSGGAKQDGISAYSPSCLAWSGDNGGATARGVTGDSITVAFRDIGNPLGDADSELAKTAEKKGIIASPEATERTRAALLEYFNSTYQLYGRTVKIVTYKGRGDAIKELGGTGQESANADALKVGQEIKAFADMTAISQPYLDALVRQKVVAFGGLHLPASYYTKRAPYAWGQLVDCTALLGSAIDLLTKRLPPTGRADRAGSTALRAKARSYGLVVPDDAVYGECINEARPKLAAAGIKLAKEIRYSLEIAKLQQESPNIAAQLKAAGVTTVLLVTDPILPFFLSGSATQQDFWPEWFLSGT